MASQIVAHLESNLDPSGSGTYELRKSREAEKVHIFNTSKQERFCEHDHEKELLVDYLREKLESSSLCPTCETQIQIGEKSRVIGARYDWFFGKQIELNDFLFEALNGWPDSTAEGKMNVHMYGNSHVEKKLLLETFKYAEIGIKGGFKHGIGDKIEDQFKISSDIWVPSKRAEKKESRGGIKKLKKLSVIILTHGVPVNSSEWFEVARILSRFYIVVTVDLLGMGNSSKPLAFHGLDEAGEEKWHWSWKTHAKIFKLLIDRLRDKELIPKGKVFFGANDWGAGVLQSFITNYGEEYLKGANINSAIALNGYWVQHIGSLAALAKLPYPGDIFEIEAIRFAGTLTSLLETMFHRTSEIHNQYSMALLQKPYVEVEAYYNVEKNPANTKYHSHAIRVLAEQASQILGNGELLPYHSKDNTNGLDFTKWNVPILMLWGKNDKMMPEGQVHRFANIVNLLNDYRRAHNIKSNLSLVYKVFEEAGHFAISDQVDKSADAIIDWIRSIEGSRTMNEHFFGLNEIARRDEKHLLDMFNTHSIY